MLNFCQNQTSNEEVLKILETELQDIENNKSHTMEKIDDKKDRFAYIDEINIKSENPAIIQFCKKLLRDTEDFWGKHTFDVGKFDKRARITMNSTKPIRDHYRPVNPNIQEEAQDIIDQLLKYKLITRGNSPYCSNPVWIRKKAPEKLAKQQSQGN